MPTKRQEAVLDVNTVYLGAQKASIKSNIKRHEKESIINKCRRLLAWQSCLPD